MHPLYPNVYVYNMLCVKIMNCVCQNMMVHVRLGCGHYGCMIVRDNFVYILFIMNLQPSFCTPLCYIIFPHSFNTFQPVLVAVNLMYRLLDILNQCY